MPNMHSTRSLASIEPTRQAQEKSAPLSRIDPICAMFFDMTRSSLSILVILLAVAVATGLYFILAPSPAERLAQAIEDKRWEAVEAQAQSMLEEAPRDEQADLFRALGRAHGRQKEHEQALEAYRAARELEPEDRDLRHRMAIEIVGIGQLIEDEGGDDEAVARFREAVELAPEIPHGHRALVWALDAQGQRDETIAALKHAMEEIPQDVNLRLRLAWLLASHPDPAKRDAQTAHALANETLMHDRTPETLDTFAVALAAQGDYQEAIRFELDAIELAGGREAPGFDERRQRLKAFTEGRPYLEPLSADR